MTSKSAVAIAMATRFPPLGRSALCVWENLRYRLGGDMTQPDHWVAIELARKLQYRVPVATRLGNGMKIHVHAHDYVGSQILRHGYYEPEIVHLVEKLLGPGMVFLDIGGHVGQYTLVASQRVGGSGSVHVFEPDPQTFSWLSGNVRRNGLKNVVLNQVALTEKPGSMRLYLSRLEDIGSNSLQPPPGSTGAFCDVACVPLDSYLSAKGVTRVDLIKMDVEGAEGMVMSGAMSLLNGTRRPPMIVEFEEERQQAFGSSCAQLTGKFHSHGYRLFRIETSGIVPYEPRTPESPSFNILAIPSDRQELLDEFSAHA